MELIVINESDQTIGHPHIDFTTLVEIFNVHKVPDLVDGFYPEPVDNSYYIGLSLKPADIVTIDGDQYLIAYVMDEHLEGGVQWPVDHHPLKMSIFDMIHKLHENPNSIDFWACARINKWEIYYSGIVLEKVIDNKIGCIAYLDENHQWSIVFSNTKPNRHE